MLLLFAALGLSSAALTAALPPFKAGESVIQFSEPAVQSGATELKWRLHSVENPKPFGLAREKFRLIVPKEYNHATPWGVFIWISPGDQPTVPKDWEPVLAARKLLFISAFNSGNPRDIFDRVRLAVDANHNLRQRFNVDGRRVYVSGFSGGGRVASMLGVAYGDMFSGTIAWMGVNFYTALPGPNGQPYPPQFIPDDEVLDIAKKACRFVLVTGEKDFNNFNTRATYQQGFVKEGFRHAHFLDVPGIAHRLPAAEWLTRALNLLENGRP